MTLAASMRAVRISESPTSVIRPTRSISPDWYRRGVSSEIGTKDREYTRRLGSSIVELKGERGDRANAWHRHQEPTCSIAANRRQNETMEPDRERRAGDR